MSTTPPLSVLVVDDDPDAAETTAELCRMYGHKARYALCGASAIQLADDETPDVVLLDVRMPGMDGCEVARRLAARPGKPPLLVAVTGEQDSSRTSAAGCHLHLLKPVHPGLLVGLLSRVGEGLGAFGTPARLSHEQGA